MTTRVDLPKKVCALLTAPANVAIHGSPGSGKSWIADQVIDGLGRLRLSIRVIRIDLSTVMSGKDVFLEIAARGSELTADQVSSVHDAWKAARGEVAGADIHTVLVLDQFDRVLRFDDAQEFLLLFRELVHRPESFHCTALIMSRRSLQSIETRVSGISTLASVCYTEYLGGLTAPDLAALGPGSRGLKKSTKAACLSWSGGHPALAKYWLATRPDRDPDPTADFERAKVVTRVLDHLMELGLVEAAAQLILGPIIHDMLFEKQELELLGVIPGNAWTSDPPESLAGLEIFRDALRHRTWNMDPWGILGRAEVRLRGVIDLLLTQAYGNDWPTTVGKKSRAVAKAHEDAMSKVERDQRMFGRQAPWLSYTYPGDLWAIVHIEWGQFSAVFDTRDRPYWREVFTGLSQYRAPLAHGRPEVLGEAERAQCRIYAEKVLERIDHYETSIRGQRALGSGT